MKYNFDEIIPRRGTNSYKWDTPEEENVLPMWVADMDFRTAPAIIETLRRRVEHGIFGYTKVPQNYYDAIVSWFINRHQWEIDSQWIIYTSGVVPAISAIIKAMTIPGDKIIVQTPVYNCFYSSIRNNGCRMIANNLIYQEGRYTIDFDDLELKAADPETKLLLLCNPHNPVGRVWTREELTSLADICLRHHVYVISDEIHGDFVWQGHEQTPYASISEEACLHSMMCTAPSKTFNLAGMATSNLFIPDPEMRRKFRSELLDVGQENMNRLGLFACRAAYEGGGEWLDQLIGYLAGNLALVRDFCKNRVPQIQLVEPEGTYLAWLDCRELGMTDDELMAFFSDEAKVWLDPGKHSGEQGSGFMRFNLGSSRSVIAQALDQIEAAWKKRNA